MIDRRGGLCSGGSTWATTAAVCCRMPAECIVACIADCIAPAHLCLILQQWRIRSAAGQGGQRLAQPAGCVRSVRNWLKQQRLPNQRAAAEQALIRNAHMIA